MIQKIIASIAMFALLLPGIVQGYTLEDQSQAQSMLGEYTQYAPVLEQALPQISRKKLEELHATLKASTPTSEGDIAHFINYALISIELELQDRNTILPQTDISDEDALKVQQEIIEFQERMETEMSGLLDSAVMGWNNASRYEEAGNFKMFLDMAFQDFMEFEGKLNISDYVSQTQVFDQEFTGDIKGEYHVSTPGIYGGDMDFSLKTNAKIISKDGKSYLKLDNFDAKSESSSEYYELNMDPFIKKINELSKSNTYLELPTEETYGYIQSFSIDKQTQDIKAQMEYGFAAPLLKAQHKTEIGYSLIPTKHFCDMGKKISGIFDPFGGEECTDSQYQDMLEDFAESGVQIHLTLGTTNILAISMVEELQALVLNVSWDESTITELTGSMRDSSSTYTGEQHTDFTFIPETSFTISSGDNNYDAHLNLTMDNNGNISAGDASITTNNDYNEDNFSLSGVFSNKNLSLIVSAKDNSDTIRCEFTGPFKKNYMDISGGCDIHSSDISYSIAGVEDLRIDSSLSYDGRVGKNNIDFSVNTHINNENHLDFTLSNFGTRRAVQAKKIQAPEKTKNIDEFSEEVYEEIYDDYEYDDYGYEDYEYEYNEYDDYSEDCYIYESGDKTCYKTYKDKSETCEYTAETDKTECEVYEYDSYYYDEVEDAADAVEDTVID